jgi:hypothetical protein
MVAPRFDTKHEEEIFQYKIAKMLLSKKKITQNPVRMLLSLCHSGFNVFCDLWDVLHLLALLGIFLIYRRQDEPPPVH